MIASPSAISTPTPALGAAGATGRPTVWGFTPTQLHDRFWAARGVQVVRQGEASEIVQHAELFLLTDPRTLAIFKIARLVDHLSWVQPDVLFLRLRDGREKGYGERIVTDAEDRFVRFERVYGGSDPKLARVALTPDPRIAQLWQNAPDPRIGWQTIRAEVPRSRRSVMSIKGNVFDRDSDAETMQFLRELVMGWKQPDSTIARARRRGNGIWADQEADVQQNVAVVGPVWVGAGRSITADSSIVGPAVLWDAPGHTPPVEQLEWQEIRPSLTFVNHVEVRQRTNFGRASKRVFDVVFSLFILAITLPMYPFIMLAIWLEDGRPFFFAHTRETMGGREFGCLKFRSMRKDAEEIKRRLMAQNQSDGPQFYMENDPRLTRIGRFLRKTNLDELPQFFNVLMGQMSVVGPRPSPFRENQYCPPWRDARLSVRPGITGLWQVRRTRLQGLDFQEWIKYDIEYVQNISWKLDIQILWETLVTVLRGVFRS